MRNNTNLLPQVRGNYDGDALLPQRGGGEIGNNLNTHSPLPWRERVRVRGNNPNNIGSNQFDLIYNINFNYNRST
ncbi:MAG: hypothetical protein U9O91_01395 [Candidatus Caldatribacteriota bacterium]|nr:hypothetical protein [Candidatus Caldatribacteriota bacterium]